MSLGVIYDGDSYIQSLDTKNDNYYNLLLNPNGNIGIGTTNPKAILNTNNVFAFENNTIRPSNSGNTEYETESLWLGKSTTSTSNFWGMSLGTIYSGNSYIQTLNTNSTSYYNLLLQPNGGNVGIGTSSPERALHIHGNSSHSSSIRISNSLWNRFYVYMQRTMMEIHIY